MEGNSSMGVAAKAGHHGLAEVLHGEEQVRHLPIRPQFEAARQGGPRKHRSVKEEMKNNFS